MSERMTDEKLAAFEARHTKAETEDCYYIEAGSFQKKEKVFCDAKTTAHKDRTALLVAIKAERAKVAELQAIIERVSSVISTWDSELYGNQIYAIEIALFPTTLKPKEGE